MFVHAMEKEKETKVYCLRQYDTKTSRTVLIHVKEHQVKTYRELNRSLLEADKKWQKKHAVKSRQEEPGNEKKAPLSRYISFGLFEISPELREYLYILEKRRKPNYC